MKYIFVTGAPGSKWSSVVKNIYFSPSLDNTDYSDERKYAHEATGKEQLMHIGAYFDPMMEFNLPIDLDSHSKGTLESIFDSAFTGTGIRIIKSHIFANHIDFIKKTWPDCPVVLVYREDDACLGWWVRCGHFNIQYPKYTYYQDLETMAKHIDRQNSGIQFAVQKYNPVKVATNAELATQLGLEQPPAEYKQDYAQNDIQVFVMR